MTPDQVCEKYADTGVKLTCRTICEDLVLIEGTREALNFLLRILGALVKSDASGFDIWPYGAGSAFFSRQSSLGIYFHRLTYSKAVKLTCGMLDESHILIEGAQKALDCLSGFLCGLIESIDCGIEISPHGAGFRLFSRQSSLGIYFHRLPCTRGTDRMADT